MQKHTIPVGVRLAWRFLRYRWSMWMIVVEYDRLAEEQIATRLEHVEENYRVDRSALMEEIRANPEYQFDSHEREKR